MPLYIRDDGVRELAHELADRQGTNVTDAVRMALLAAKQNLDRDRAERDTEARAALHELRRLRREPVREDVLYDEHGLPRL